MSKIPNVLATIAYGNYVNEYNKIQHFKTKVSEYNLDIEVQRVTNHGRMTVDIVAVGNESDIAMLKILTSE